MTEKEAEKALKQGVKRGGAVLLTHSFENDDLIFTVKREHDSIAHQGREYGITQLSPNIFEARVWRFCLHYVQKQNYYMPEHFGSIRA